MGRLRAILIGLLFLCLFACAQQAPMPNTDDSLYRALGGSIGIDDLVVDTLGRVHSNQRIAFLFEEIDENNLAEQLREQLCWLSGGPCVYEGLAMWEAHAGMGITKAEFDIFVALFVEAMEARQIPFSVQNRLLAKLAPMRADIIYQ